jgi:hypothetical protein
VKFIERSEGKEREIEKKIKNAYKEVAEAHQLELVYKI